jgi:rod shape-determining protein MreB
VEKRAFYEVFYKSKFRPKSVLLCEKPIADAVGLGIDVNEPTGVMVVNMGGDTTEISVISLGGLVLSSLLDFGGNRLDEAIISYIRKEFNLVIGQKTAMALKENIGSGLPGRTETMTIVGRDVVSGLPIEMEITADVVYEATKSNLENICTSIKMILEKTPPELAKDIIHSGIYITGGGSKIYDLDKLFEQITNIRVNTCDAPEESAVRGLVKIVSDSKYKRLPFTIKNNTLR